MAKVRKIIFDHTTSLFYDSVTKKVSYEVKNKSFSIWLDKTKKNHVTIANWLSTGTLYESDVSGVMCRLIRPGDLVVDVGANIGFHSFLMAALVEENGKVMAYEPASEVINEWESNKKLNKSKNVSVSQKLLSDKSGDTVDFHFSQDDSGTSYALKNQGKDEPAMISMVTSCLDDELTDNVPIKLIKIDVEGFEGHILRGASKLLSEDRVKYWVVEYAPHCLARNGDSLESLRSIMSQYGLNMFLIDIQGGFPKLWPEGLRIHTKFVTNLLFTRIEDLVKDWVIDDVSRFVSPPSNW